LLRLTGIIVFAYLLGSIPTGVIAGRLLRGIDIRGYGSASSGGTNALRVLGWKPGLLVILVDLAKGYAAVWWSTRLLADAGSLAPESVAVLAGLVSVIGHIFPVFAGFRGGKGVAPSAGVLLAVQPPAFAFCVVSFAVLLAVSRIVSVASIGASVLLSSTLAIMRWIVDLPVSAALLRLGLALAVLIPLAHRDNIARLLSGLEPTIGTVTPNDVKATKTGEAASVERHPSGP
jgi:glycerol-3-phosphate acyltransferase PlsY